jgi:hypothetical protein
LVVSERSREVWSVMMHEQSTATPMERTAPSGLPSAPEDANDPDTRIHLYQQQLRAELLGAASASASRPWARWPGLLKTASTLGLPIAPVRAIESLVKGLTEAGVGFTYRRSASLGTGAR